MTATAAPTSSRFSKFSAKASRTRSNRGSHVPSISGISIAPLENHDRVSTHLLQRRPCEDVTVAFVHIRQHLKIIDLHVEYSTKAKHRLRQTTRGPAHRRVCPNPSCSSCSRNLGWPLDRRSRVNHRPPDDQTSVRSDPTD